MKKFLLFIFALASGSMSLLAQPVITSQPTNQFVVSGGNATFRVMVTGVGPFTYQWQLNGTNLPTTNIITTVAGNGSLGFSGDGGSATNAQLNSPGSIVVDQFGNIFIADTSNRRVRKVDTNGIITTIAGTGSSGFTGDGGTATNATLNLPQGVAVDGFGNLFIADLNNSRIRKVDTNGIISTIIGTNGIGFSGDGGPAYLAKMSGPRSVTLDSFGNIFIADTFNKRIRKIDTNGIINTVTGTNTLGFSGDGGPANTASLQSPYGVSLDGFGNIFIADTGNNRIHKVDTNGIISTFAGTNTFGSTGDGGSAITAKLNQPSRAISDAFGNLLIADTLNNRIRKVDTNGIISLFAGTNSSLTGYSGDGGAATNAKLNHPYDLTLDPNGNLVFADSNNHCIRKVNLNGSPTLNVNAMTTNSAGNYRVIITSPSGSSTSDVVNLAVVFTTPPTNVSVTNGTSASFNVVAYGAGPFSYQWFFNTNTAIDGGTNATLIVTNANFGQSGNYFCAISNASGSVTSSIETLTIIVFPPSIIVQPFGVAAPIGGSANFNVSVSGDAPFGYQWFTSSGYNAYAFTYVLGGQVQFAVVTSLGAGYSFVPHVQFVGGGGSGASGTAVMNNGMVTAININNPGSGYTTFPRVIIDPPSPTINTLMSDQTNAVLALSAITNATNYFVVVTNNYGSVTSTMVPLVVFLPPQNFFVQNVGTGLQMQFTGTPYYPYILQSATNLTPPINWQSIFTNSVDVNGNWQFTDTNLNAGQKFYRAEGK